MRIVIGDRTKEYMSLLGISEYPFSSKELSERFRITIKLVHPDVSDKKDNNLKTREVIQAYKSLKNLAIDPSEEITKFYQEETEKDLFELTEVCPVCHGRKTKLIQEDTRPCPDCSIRSYLCSFFLSGGLGFKRVKCRKCDGIGKFRDKGICFNCNGTGQIKVRCKTCNGEGYIIISSKTVLCDNCKGRGKIILNPFNPVIPKGAVLTGGQR
jgi:DnaJ-class molecular chaperone